MVKARKYVVKKVFQGLPKREDFEIVEYKLPALKNGEILVKVEWVSVDPFMRAYNSIAQVGSEFTPYDQFGFQIGLVEESRDARYPVGTRVVSHKSWCDYVIIDTNVPDKLARPVYKLPDLSGLSNSFGIGAAGMHGATAYFGFLKVCQPKEGETVVVTGAAGAVGSVVGQIAKIKGCKVIGFAGSDEKAKWLEEIGFDKAINYKTADVTAALKEAAPGGVDCFFDNVGGDVSNDVIYQMNEFGRAAICGSISVYNLDRDKRPKGALLQPVIVGKQLRIEGLNLGRWLNQLSVAHKQLIKWIRSGKLIPREHVTEGFENIYDAFVGMLKGENVVKAVVKYCKFTKCV